MNIEISCEIEARLKDEARRAGVSVNALLERLMNDRGASAHTSGSAELPVWHLGGAGSLHRRDIYDDVR